MKSSTAWFKCQSFSETSCLAMSAARFSAISSRNAALHLMERSTGASQESLLDDRRERAHPAHDKYGKSSTIRTKIQ